MQISEKRTMLKGTLLFDTTAST